MYDYDISLDLANEIEIEMFQSQKSEKVFLTFLHRFACRVF